MRELGVVVGIDGGNDGDVAVRNGFEVAPEAFVAVGIAEVVVVFGVDGVAESPVVVAPDVAGR